VLVAEADGRVVATGGIEVLRAKDVEAAWLSYGMVLPEHQRRGIGTTLLLARLSLLPRVRTRWIVLMASVSGSESFYGRFGFRPLGDLPGADDPSQMQLAMIVPGGDPARLSATLAARGVRVDHPGGLPVRDLSDATAGGAP
jgi:predicted N-acetyltransferase YhbS